MRKPVHGFEALTPTETEVLAQLAMGMGVAEIAEARHITLGTARHHSKTILFKLDVHSQLKAVALWHQRELAECRKEALREAGQLVRDHVLGAATGEQVADFLDKRAARLRSVK